jgi:CRP/FNR family transcriptional regulator
VSRAGKSSEVLAALRRCPLFSGLSARDTGLFAAGARAIEAGRGETVFREGERADGFYVVESGQVRLYKSAPGGREQTLHVVEPGGTFGDAAVFYGGTYPASAVATRPSRLVYVDGGRFLELVESRPALALEIMASLSQRLREFAGLIEALSLREVSSRLAKYLLDEAARAGAPRFRLPVAKNALAGQLGTVAETLSRSLSALVRGRLVAVSGREVRVLDPEGLARVSAGLRP